MVTTPRKIEIRDGKITLPEDMLEESGIGTSDGFVLVSLRESGEIIVRSYHERNDRREDPGRTGCTDIPESMGEGDAALLGGL